MSYQEQKDQLRKKAIQWKKNFSKNKDSGFTLYRLSKKTSYYSLVYIQRYFYNQAKKFGLLKEFKEMEIL